VVELTDRVRGQTDSVRDSLPGYRKFGAEVKIIDIDEKTFADNRRDAPVRPETAPALKPGRRNQKND